MPDPICRKLEHGYPIITNYKYDLTCCSDHSQNCSPTPVPPSSFVKDDALRSHLMGFILPHGITEVYVSHWNNANEQGKRTPTTSPLKPNIWTKSSI